MEHDLEKEASIYMRFHVTLEKAINFTRNLYGTALLPHSKITLLEHAVQISGLTEEITMQDYIDYHLSWLTGILKDTLSFDEEVYRASIDDLLSELYQAEADRIKLYIEQLTYRKGVSQGKSYQLMLQTIEKMEVVPCYLQIFQLFSQSREWKARRWDAKVVDLQGFLAFAYLCWHKAIDKNQTVGKNIPGYIKEFFRDIYNKQFNGEMKLIRQKAKAMFSTL